MSNYRLFTQIELMAWQKKLLDFLFQSFQDSVQMTMNWWNSKEAKEFYQTRQYRLTEFFNESGIANEWSTFATNRASEGADIVEQIYNHAREIRCEDVIVEYTTAERDALNYLCDYNYELIKDVTEEQIQGIREALIQDFAEGRNSKETEILAKLEEVQLQPIHTFSAEQRARMIARTETSRASNIATLQQFKRDGVKYVSPFCNSDCEECNSHASEIYTVDEALEEPIYHPNCSCTWTASKGPEWDRSDTYIRDELVQMG